MGSDKMTGCPLTFAERLRYYLNTGRHDIYP